MKPFLIALLFTLCLPLAGQTPTYEELEFEADSLTIPYKPVGKNYAFIRSKRGTNGLGKTSRADSIVSFPVTDIILVFSELSSSAIEEREEANQERWENLLKTYPEFFQFSTSYKNLCQCNVRGDSALFKKAQGFYVYFTGEEPKAEEKKVESKKARESEAAVVAVEKPAAKIKEAPSKTSEEPLARKNEEPAVKTKEAPAKENFKESAPVPSKGQEETLTIAPSEGNKKRAGYTKPRKAKDPKACRPSCYGMGQEDLDAFFKDNITLTKKQRRHGKQLISVVRLQLNFDGSIKKAMVTGAVEVLNQQVVGAVKNMNPWNPAVKGGVTVKSEAKITLKYDKASKAMKPFEVAITPRQPLKCKCASDSELFGD